MNIVITGSSSGLGAMLMKVLKVDANVIGIDATFGDDHSTTTYLCNLSNPDEIENTCKQIRSSCDILINCAGVASIDYIENISVGEWNYVMDVNARAPFLMVQGLLEDLIKNKGLIINITSDAASRPMTASLAYCASKAALEQMTRVMARELTRKYDIKVLGIAPAKIADTQMSNYVDRRVQTVRGWSKYYTEQYHRENVLMTTDIDVAELAWFIHHIITSNHWRHLSGCIIPYGG